MRTRPCDRAVATGRVKKAAQFYDAAETIRELADDEGEIRDAFVTLCVHSGIAAADAICCAALGEHAQGESHSDAVQLLAQVNPGGGELGLDLQTLLGLKTNRRVSFVQRAAAMRCAQR